MSEIGSKQNPPPKNIVAEIVPMVIADLEGRKKMGKERYGKTLRVENGRDALLDLYQELLDAVLYIRQRIVQEDTKLTRYERVVGLVRELVAKKMRTKGKDESTAIGKMREMDIIKHMAYFVGQEALEEEASGE